MMKISIVALVLLLFFVAIVWLQVFLLKKQSKFLGLILPSISFISSLLMVLGLASYKTMSFGGIFGLVVPMLLVSNIPTIVLIAIYIASRETIKRNKEIEKMNIQDLE